jgi:acetyltransferase-like isoleucine patch superfamily enzyme
MCDIAVTIGDYSLLGWDVVIMDSYRGRGIGAPVCIGNRVWIGFGACILPGVKIGDGAVIGARAVVASDVPPHAISVGNPARIV